MSAIFLENKQMTAGFDPETGKLISIRMKGDPLKTEYIGNRKNISYPSIREANQWMGDVRFRIWDENAEGWREERTADSEDNRIVSVEEDKVRVSWLEPSEKQKGIRTLNTEQTFPRFSFPYKNHSGCLPPLRAAVIRYASSNFSSFP